MIYIFWQWFGGWKNGVGVLYSVYKIFGLATCCQPHKVKISPKFTSDFYVFFLFLCLTTLHDLSLYYFIFCCCVYFVVHRCRINKHIKLNGSKVLCFVVVC